MKKLIPLAVMAVVAGCSSAPKDVYLSCMPEKVEITTVGGVDPGKEQGDPKDYDFLLRFNIDEQTANEGSDIYTIDESENELRFDLKNPEDDGSNYIIVNRKDLSYVRRRMFGEIYKDGYTMFFDDNGSCEKVDKPSSPDNQI
tara:strand:+ start:63 stop:491 length:429 start_codon:yes stop_codon:yes gene_type:complete